MTASTQCLIPVVMSGIIAVYGLVVSVLIASDIAPPPGKNYALFEGFMHLACGLSVGLAGIGAGYAIGIVGDSVGHLGYFHNYCSGLFCRVFEHTCNSPESL